MCTSTGFISSLVIKNEFHRAWKVAPALACGCTIVMKPSEFTPLTALVCAHFVISNLLVFPPLREGLVDICFHALLIILVPLPMAPFASCCYTRIESCLFFALSPAAIYALARASLRDCTLRALLQGSLSGSRLVPLPPLS